MVGPLIWFGGVVGGWVGLNGIFHNRPNDFAKEKIQKGTDLVKEYSGEDGNLTYALNAISDKFEEWTAPRDGTTVVDPAVPQIASNDQNNVITTSSTDPPATTTTPPKQEEEEKEGWGILSDLTGKLKDSFGNMGWTGKAAAAGGSLLAAFLGFNFLKGKAGNLGGIMNPVLMLATVVAGIFGLTKLFNRKSEAPEKSEPKTDVQHAFHDNNTHRIKLEKRLNLEESESKTTPEAPEAEQEEPKAESSKKSEYYVNEDGELRKTNTGFNEAGKPEPEIEEQLIADADNEYEPQPYEELVLEGD